MAHALVVVVLVLYLALVHRTFSSLLFALGFGDVPLHDFRFFYYPMGAHVLTAHPGPVEGFLYSPWAALCFAPFGSLPYGASAWCWAAVLLVLAVLLAREAVALADGNPWLSFLAVGLTASSFPVLHDLKFGQVGLLVAVALFGCVRLYERGHVKGAASCLAFAAAFKFYPIVFLSFFCFRKDWRFVRLALAILVVMLVVVPVVVLGAHETWRFYVGIVEQLRERVASAVTDRNSQSLVSLGHRLLFDRWHAPPALRAAFNVVRVVIGGAILFVVYRASQRRGVWVVREAFLVLFAATPFFVTTCWPHYFVYLPAIVIGALRGLPAAGWRRTVTWIGALGAALVSNVVSFEAVRDRNVYTYWGVLFFANLAALIALLAGPLGADLPSDERRAVQ